MSDPSDASGPSAGHVSPFEAIRHEDDAGGEYWSARELAKMLTYTEWRNFAKVIDQARAACEGSGHAVSDHFVAVNKMIEIGKGAQRTIADVHLSRYACYLVVQNGDPDKPVIAAGQTYFAVQTRRQENADAAALTEAQLRILTRNEVTHRNVELAAAAHGAGVLTGRDFAIFQDHGYMGLYNGETARKIAERKGLKKGEAILDWMGSTELAANLFRATQTKDKIEREGIADKDAANRAHHNMGKAVRQFIADQGGTMPEKLPTPAESIQQLERTEAQRLEAERLEAERQPSLFPALPEPEPDEA